MKLRAVLLLILSFGWLFFNTTFVKAEPEIILSVAGKQQKTFKELLQTAREERKTQIETMKANFETERVAFKEKLKAIKDEKKKKLAEKIDNRMSIVNKNQTARMIKALEKLTEHINKLEGKVTDQALIADAKTDISAAMAAVEQQAAKDYVFIITDEKNLGQSIKTSFDALSQDLKNTQELLVKAKDAVVAAYKAQ